MELIWVVAAFVSGIAARALRLPTLVGYLAAGLVLALGGVEKTPQIEAVGDLGVVLLLFTVGLHINLRSLVQTHVIGVGALHLAVTTGLFTGVLVALQLPTVSALLLAISLGFSSTVLTAKTLDERDELGTFHGRLAIGILVFQDIVAILLLAVAGGAFPRWWAVGLLALPLARPLMVRLMLAAGRDDLLLIYGLLLALGAGWLFDVVGLDAKLGALVVGMILAGGAGSEQLYKKLWALKELFLVGFFLQVGLAGLPDARGWTIIAAFMLLLPLKGILFFVLIVSFKLRARTAFLSSISLTAYSEFALIVAAGAAASGLILERYAVMVGLLVALSYAANAPVSRAVNRLWRVFEARLTGLQRAAPHPDHEPNSLGSAEFVVLGMGRAGAAAYDFLTEGGKRVLGLDADPAQIRGHLHAGRRVVYGDAQDPHLWTKLDLTSVRGVLITLRTVAAESSAARSLRAKGYDGPIAALLRHDENREELEASGVTVSLLPIAEAGRELAEACISERP